MNRQFSFKDHQNTNQTCSKGSNLASNWTDQRVMEIMKKYQKPNPTQKCRQKENYERFRVEDQGNHRSPLRENTFNIDSACRTEKKMQKSPWKGQENNFSYESQFKKTQQDQKRYSKSPYINKSINMPSNMSNKYQQKQNKDSSSRQNYHRIETCYNDSYQKQIKYSNPAFAQKSYEYSPNQVGRAQRKKQTTTIPRYNRQSFNQNYQRDSFNCDSSDRNQFREGYKRENLKTEIYSKNYTKSYKQDYPFQKQNTEKWKEQCFDRYPVSSKKQYNPRSVTENQEKYKINHEMLNLEAAQNIFKNVEYDSRISNIERINQKIKKILESGNGDQIVEKKDQSIDFGKRRPTISPFNYQKQSNKIGQENKKQIPRTRENLHQLQQAKKPWIGSQNKENSKNEDKMRGEKCETIHEMPINKIINRQGPKIQKTSLIQPRSKSCLGSKRKIENERTTYVLNEDQKNNKIQEKILKFNQKIAELQEQKRKLNITFQNQNMTPKLTKNEYMEITPKNDKSAIFELKINKDIIKKSQSKENLNAGNAINSQQQQSYRQDNIKNEQVPQPKYNGEDIQHQSPYINLKDFETLHQSNCQAPDIQFQQPSSVYDNESLRHKIAERIEDRKRKLNHFEQTTIPNNSEISKLLKLFSEQVKLDEKFRESKNWFMNSEINNKLQSLQEVLSQRWREMTTEEIEYQFSINYQEQDPFYSYRADQFKIQDMVNNYIICNKHWKQKIENHWNIKQLVEVEKLIDNLDLEKKGHIAIEDFVRLINMEQGTFYRNRDLYLVFKRIQDKGSEHEQILHPNILCIALGQR